MREERGFIERMSVYQRMGRVIAAHVQSDAEDGNPREIQARDVAARRADVLDARQTDSQDTARDTTVPWLRTGRVPLELIMKRFPPS
ncbi:hypothetical protein OG982_26315 [Streptomyces sp. NBC_01551]|uniref:hypothetical protein n=1 Tax=Streptomyces sp. NBC_01551 TaxID=2975876 RepID=UPI00224FBF95|nr:hypothetical protein [Streptomyces sp. NBC_01551]MCX4529164.1 hypothetical protein [Streptomyces sp. NBC_01551]